MTEIQAHTEIKILKAAEEEFLNKGYDGAKTMNIAKKAGVTHAMLHYYYRTKENLYNKILDAKISLLSQSIMAPFINVDLPITEKIRRGMGAHFDFLRANPALPRFVVNEILSNETRVGAVAEKLEKILSNMLPPFQSQLDDMYNQGKMVKVNAIHLILDITSLNVFTFTVMPLLKLVISKNFPDIDDFLEHRKAENIDVIMRRILVNPMDYEK